MSRRRNFNRSERAALYLIADGKCQMCGEPLPQSFHTDHVHPYSKGGATDIVNGQALCPKCNQIKGDQVLANLGEWTRPLRDWQENARSKYLGDNRNDWLVVATPGAGKTTFCLRIAYDMLVSNRIERIVVIVPSDHLCKQWCYAASEYGIHLTPDWKNSSGSLPSDFIGVAITYQQVASGAGRDVVRWLVGQKPTLAIIDEIHHAGETKSWGDSLKYALEPAVRRIAASGTPFRGDNEVIPFVTYADGRSQSDYNYGYGQALRDGVCRLVFFPTFEGEMEWLSSSGDIVTATFETELKEFERRERLNTAISPSGDWIPDVIKTAHEKLKYVQATSQKDAKGLIVCKDKTHARGKDEADNIADLLEKITGKRPAIALSDDPKASDVIKAFGTSSTDWLVAVKMVSEGVDIPNLRVGVYATNILSELYFRQFIGRFVRMQPDIEDQSAYVYIPRDPELLSYASAIKDERDHYLMDDTTTEREPREPSTPSERGPSMFMPISSIGIEHNVLDVDKQEHTPQSINYAAELKQRLGLTVSPEIIALILNEAGVSPTPQAPTGQQHSPVTASTDPLFIQRQKLSNQCAGLARRYAMSTGQDHWQPHTVWIEQHGGSKQEHATIDELSRKRDWLIGLLKDLKHGKR